jgi:hypothetical protein
VAGSGPTGAELRRVTELALRRGARSVAVGHGRSAAAAAEVTEFARRWEAGGGTQRAIGLVGAHNLHGLAGATADGGTWTVCNGNLRLAPRGKDTAP